MKKTKSTDTRGKTPKNSCGSKGKGGCSYITLLPFYGIEPKKLKKAA